MTTTAISSEMAAALLGSIIFGELALLLGASMLAGDEGIQLEAEAMAQLTVRNVSDEMVGALKRRAALHGRSVEAEHQDILRKALFGAAKDFAARAKALRQRLRSSVDSSKTIRDDRDRDGAE